MAPKDDSPDGLNLSRRNFLKSAGVGGIAAAVVAPAETEAQTACRPSSARAKCRCGSTSTASRST